MFIALHLYTYTNKIMFTINCYVTFIVELKNGIGKIITEAMRYIFFCENSNSTKT